MNTYVKSVSAAVRLIAATAVVMVATLSMAYASVSKKVALVIGNGQYQSAAPLVNPGHDAIDMTLKLKGLGFDVVSGQDLDLRALRKTVREFIDKTQGADVALFFYAGHGLQVSGQNYLLPVDANLKKEDDLDFETLPVKMVLNAMERNSKTTLLFLDACRNNPLSRGLARSMGTRSASIGRGLAEIGSGVGTLISFATKPGAVALDGKGRNSPFTTALLKHIGTPNQDIARTLINVRKDVLVATNRAQVPWENSSLTRRVILNDAGSKPAISVQQPVGASVAATPAIAPTTPALAPAARSNNSLLQVEIAFWSSVERAGTAEGYRTYLSSYPTGAFSQLAQIELRKLEAAKVKPQLVPDPASKKKPVQVASLEKTEVAAVEPVQPGNNPAAPAGPATPKPELSEYDIVYGVQKELKRLGCRPGSVDGIAGRNTSRALGRYSRASGNDVRNDGYTPQVLKILTDEKTIYCESVSKKRVASVSSGRKKAIKTRSVTRERKKKIKNAKRYKPKVKKAKSKSKARKAAALRRAEQRRLRNSRAQRRARRERARDREFERRRPRRVERRRDRDFERRERRRRAVATGVAVGIAGAILFGRKK